MATELPKAYDPHAAQDRWLKFWDEKGYFLFGASTVVLLGEPGSWKPEADLLEQTGLGRETFVKIGDRIGHKA